MSAEDEPSAAVQAVRAQLAQVEDERALVRALEVAVSRVAAILERQTPGAIAEIFGPVARRAVDADDSTFQAFLDLVDAKLSKVRARAEATPVPR